MKQIFKNQRVYPQCVYSRGKRGITGIEILFVVAVVGIIISVIIPQFSQIRENQVIKAVVEDVLSSLNKARGQTLSSLNSSEYGVHFQPDKIIIFKGKVFSSNASDNETVSIVSGVDISNVTFGGISGESGDIYFNRLSGSPNTTGTVTVSTSSYSKIITISATGTANSN